MQNSAANAVPSSIPHRSPSAVSPWTSRTRPLIYPLLVLGLMAIHFLLVWDILRRQTPTVDEVAHLPAGLSYLDTGTFRLYRHNPPLVKVLAGFAARWDAPRLDYEGSWKDLEPANQWSFAFETLTANANDEDDRQRYLDAFTRARLVVAAWSTLTIPVLYLWGAWWFGPTSGLLAAALWSLCANIIAHAALVTTDVPATSAGLLTTFLFARWLDRPTWTRASLVGLALGTAQLVKFTLLGLYPLLAIWGVAAGIFRLLARRADREFPPFRWVVVAQVGIAFVLSLFVLNAGYLFEGTFTRLGDFPFVSRTLTRERTVRDAPPPDTQNELYRQAWQRRANRFDGTALGLLPCPLPYHYVAGFDQQKFDSESTYPMYLRGELARPSSPAEIFDPKAAGARRGWWHYYFYALLLKVPLGTWLLLMAAGAMALLRPGKERVAALVYLALAPILAMSFLTDINIGVRYVLVAFPFLFLCASSLVADDRPRPLVLVAVLALMMNLAAIVRFHPHEMAYFNELTGATDEGKPIVAWSMGNGARFGRFHLIDSNIDWGQDLRNLARWLNHHPDWKESVRLAYFGSVPPEWEGIESYRLAPRDLREVAKAHHSPFPSEDPKDPTTWGPQPGKFAVSVNFERGLRFHTPCPRKELEAIWDKRRAVGSPRRDWLMLEVPRESYAYFQHFTPRILPEIGYSILLYDISLEDANRVREKIGLPPLPGPTDP